MSSPFTCVPCNSSTPVSTNIPGPMGDTGPYPITTTTADFTVPSVSSNVTVSVVSTVPFVQGPNVFVDGANFVIYSINNPTSLTLTALGFPGDTTGIVPSGSTIVSGTGNLLASTIAPITTSGFTIPAVGSFVAVSVTSTSQLSLGENVYIGSATFYVTAIGSSIQFTAVYLGFSGDTAAGSIVASQTQVISGVGNLKATPGRTVLLAALTIPAIGTTVVATVLDSSPFYPGQIVSLVNATQAANFIVTAASGGTVTLRTLGWPNDTAPTAVVAATSVLQVGSANIQLQRSVGLISVVALLSGAGGSGGFTHGLLDKNGAAVVPSYVRAVIRCTTSDANSGYTAGQELDPDTIVGTGLAKKMFTFFADATQVTVISNPFLEASPFHMVKMAGTADVVLNDGSGGSANMDNFSIYVYAQV